MEPGGPAGDRRWTLIDDGGKVVTQRRPPHLAPAAAELLPGGGVRLSAHAWCGTPLGADVRLVHPDDPATRRPVDPACALPP